LRCNFDAYARAAGHELPASAARLSSLDGLTVLSFQNWSPRQQAASALSLIQLREQVRMTGGPKALSKRFLRSLIASTALEVDRLIVDAGSLECVTQHAERENKMKKLLFSLTVVGIMSAGTTSTFAAAEVVRSFVEGRYNYKCIELRGGHYCANWNVVQ
jgi:hypothetical protein